MDRFGNKSQSPHEGRHFPSTSKKEVAALLKAGDRIKAFENISATTIPRDANAELKRNIVLEMQRRNLPDVELLRECTTVYIGAGTDIEYPLALGARRIRLVDPNYALETHHEGVL